MDVAEAIKELAKLEGAAEALKAVKSALAAGSAELDTAKAEARAAAKDLRAAQAALKTAQADAEAAKAAGGDTEKLVAAAQAERDAARAEAEAAKLSASELALGTALRDALAAKGVEAKRLTDAIRLARPELGDGVAVEDGKLVGADEKLSAFLTARPWLAGTGGDGGGAAGQEPPPDRSRQTPPQNKVNAHLDRMRLSLGRPNPTPANAGASQ